MELYAAVQLAIVEEGLSHHEAGGGSALTAGTVKKMLSYSAPPGYRRRKPVRRPKLDGFTGIIDAILEADRAPSIMRCTRRFPARTFRCSARSPSSSASSGRAGRAAQTNDSALCGPASAADDLLLRSGLGAHTRDRGPARCVDQ